MTVRKGDPRPDNCGTITAPCRCRRMVTDHQPGPNGGMTRTIRGGAVPQQLPLHPGHRGQGAAGVRSCTARSQAAGKRWLGSGRRRSRPRHRPRTPSPPIRPCLDRSLAGASGEVEAGVRLAGSGSSKWRILSSDLLFHKFDAVTPIGTPEPQLDRRSHVLVS